MESTKEEIKVADKDEYEIKGLDEYEIKGLDEYEIKGLRLANTAGENLLTQKDIDRINFFDGENNPKEEVKARFNMFDVDGNGKLTKKKLATVAKEILGEAADFADEQGMNTLTMIADADKDGTLTFDEFCLIMKI